MNYLQLMVNITDQYRRSIARGHTREYLEGAQIARLRLSHELCPYVEGSMSCIDWRRGFFNEIGKAAR